MSTTAPRREVRKVSSRWPVTVAAVLGCVALLLVAFVALKSDQNDVLSFAGVPSEVVVQASAAATSSVNAKLRELMDQLEALAELDLARTL